MGKHLYKVRLTLPTASYDDDIYAAVGYSHSSGMGPEGRDHEWEFTSMVKAMKAEGAIRQALKGTYIDRSNSYCLDVITR